MGKWGEGLAPQCVALAAMDHRWANKGIQCSSFLNARLLWMLDCYELLEPYECLSFIDDVDSTRV